MRSVAKFDTSRNPSGPITSILVWEFIKRDSAICQLKDLRGKLVLSYLLCKSTRLRESILASLLNSIRGQLITVFIKADNVATESKH